MAREAPSPPPPPPLPPARRRFSSARQYASGKASPRCWRWRFFSRCCGARVNQHPLLGRRPLCAHGYGQRGRERLGLTAGGWGQFAQSLSEITWKPATRIAAGSFRSRSGAIGCALGDLWGRSARTYLLRHSLAGLRKNRRSSSITCRPSPRMARFPPPRRPQARLGISGIRRYC
jgi:hypothetical protein